MSPRLRQQIVSFVIIGTASIAIDASVYILLFKHFAMNPSGAKTAGFLSGALCSYALNRKKTFQSDAAHAPALCKFVLLYLSTLSCNVASNSFLLQELSFTVFKNFAYLIAFGLATALSIILNFLGLKFFVFAEKT